MLLEEFEYRVETSKCDVTATKLRAVAEFEVDVSCVFPYLNATFACCEYSPDAGVLRLRSGGRVYAIHRRMIVTGVADISEAQPAFSHVRDVINETWEKRAQITPREEPRARPPALAVYRLLPRTNCGRCGENSCMAFAAKARAGKVGVEDCPALDPDSRRELADILAFGRHS